MRKKKTEIIDEVVRVDADPKFGLTQQQVNERIAAKMVNDDKKPVGKSYAEIFLHNFVNVYNLIFVIVTIMLVYARAYTSLFFVVIYAANLVIGLFQDLRAKHLLSKLQLVSQATTSVIREGKDSDIPVSQIVLDDIIILKSGDQISTDAIVINGNIGINESILTGESLTVYKERASIVYAGSYVVSGTATARVLRVGKDNYINTLETKARSNKGITSKLKKSLDRLFWIILFIVIPLFITSIFANATDLKVELQDTVKAISGSIIAMIPSGLYLLASASLTVGVINLAKKRTMVQDMYSLEMLARSTMLCLDKTGTITDGTMSVTELVPLGKVKKDELELIIANMLNATHDDNATAKAMKEAFPFGALETPLYTVPFNSQNKYSFVCFRKATYVLGALECMDAIDKEKVAGIISKYAQQGLRVVVLAKAKEKQIDNKTIKGKVEVIGLIVLQDHIKEDAPETIAWFEENSVKIRVISGDNAETVSHIADRVNISNADKYISLEGMTNQEVRDCAPHYTVFGRVTPEQKEILVEAFKEAGETVAMTGDGVNDILALRKADCSIAMANGADAAQNVSQLVMLDSNFSSLPAVVAEGRRTINNIQRTTALFLTKTFFAMVLTLIFVIAKFTVGRYYPFSNNHLYMWELSTIGIGSFFVALEPNSERIEPGFMRNIFKKAVPGALLMILGVGLFYTLYMFDFYGVMYTGVDSEEVFVTMCSLFFAVASIAVFYRICTPLSVYRGIILGLSFLINAGCIAFQACMEIYVPGYIGGFNVFDIILTHLVPVNILELCVITVGMIAIYLTVTYIIDVVSKRLKEKKAND